MLEHLFGSKTRIKLLQIFLNHPENSYYVRELTRLTKLQINAIRRELQNLEDLEVVGSFQEAKSDRQKRRRKNPQEKKYYRANIDYVLFPELKALILKAQLLLEYDLAKKISRIGTVKYLALTGIFVGFVGASTDLFVVGNIKKERLVQLIRKFEKELNYEINFTLMSSSEYRYRKDITDRFLYSILENKKIVVLDNL
jgi:hypothetical protein